MIQSVRVTRGGPQWTCVRALEPDHVVQSRWTGLRVPQCLMRGCDALILEMEAKLIKVCFPFGQSVK